MTFLRSLRIFKTSCSLAKLSLRQVASVSQQSIRQNHSFANQNSQDDHLITLRRNEELTDEDAINELRWITQETRAKAERMMSKGKMPSIEEDSIAEMVERRSKGEPLQYILGITDFGPLQIQCRRPVLIPRPETAYLTQKISSLILSTISPLTSRDRPSSPLDILDLCSGTGCIGLLLSKLNPLSTVTGIDNSPVAVQLGMINSRDLDLGDRVKFRYGNLFKDPISLLRNDKTQGKGKYGFIISNPPYIPYSQYQYLPKSVKNYESPTALLGDLENKHGGKGLEYYKRIIEILPDLLLNQEELDEMGWKNIPRLALEIGKGQSEDVVDIIKTGSRGLIQRTEVWKDQFGIDRMVVGWSK